MLNTGLHVQLDTRFNFLNVRKSIFCCSALHSCFFVALWYCTVCRALSVLLWRRGTATGVRRRRRLMSVAEEKNLDAAVPRRSSSTQSLSYAELPQQCTVVLYRLASSTSPYFNISTVVGLPPTSLQSVANPITVLTTNGPIIWTLESSVRMLNRYPNYTLKLQICDLFESFFFKSRSGCHPWLSKMQQCRNLTGSKFSRILF